VESDGQIVDQLWSGVTPKTKVIFISHITSPTALTMPVEIICARAREQGIVTLVDGAHAAGQLDLDLPSIGADFYTGNCHKWMLSPKGAAFLYTRKEMQSIIQPLVVSWGYSPTAQNSHGSRYVDLLAWTGTRDPAAALAVPAAISFMKTYHWDSVRHSCNVLLHEAIQEIHNKFQTEPIAVPGTNFFAQMGTASLPESTNLTYLKENLYERYKIEIPCVEWNQKKMVRISVQGYNTKQDLDHLIQALDDLLGN
jgi:isopenicillin-N epimerase